MEPAMETMERFGAVSFSSAAYARAWKRVAHLRKANLPGGDAAAQYPVQCAAGFLAQIAGAPDVMAAPFHFPARYRDALRLVEKGVRTFDDNLGGPSVRCSRRAAGLRS